MKITGTLDVRKYDAHYWDILRVIKFTSDNGSWVQIKPNFRLDFGSIPRGLRSIVSPMGSLADWGFVPHDGLYSKHRDNNPLVVTSHNFTRKEADQLMLEIHLHCGVSQELAEGIYMGVRLGASYSWLTPAEKTKRLARNQLPSEILE